MSLHDKHRERLDKKVKAFDFEMLEAHEQLEHILFAVIPRGDTNGTAHRLLERFGTISAVLNAPEVELVKVEGVGPRTAKFLNDLPILLGIVERSLKTSPPPKLSNAKEIYEFAKSYFYGKLTESAYILSMNSSYRLIGVSKISDGISGEVFVFPSRVARQALLDGASAIAIVHNHPCGTLNPSFNDIEITRKIKEACKALEIDFVDSVIISSEGYFSIRQKGYIDELWREYNK